MFSCISYRWTPRLKRLGYVQICNVRDPSQVSPYPEPLSYVVCMKLQVAYKSHSHKFPWLHALQLCTCVVGDTFRYKHFGLIVMWWKSLCCMSSHNKGKFSVCPVFTSPYPHLCLQDKLEVWNDSCFYRVHHSHPGFKVLSWLILMVWAADYLHHVSQETCWNTWYSWFPSSSPI